MYAHGINLELENGDGLPVFAMSTQVVYSSLLSLPIQTPPSVPWDLRQRIAAAKIQAQEAWGFQQMYLPSTSRTISSYGNMVEGLQTSALVMQLKLPDSLLYHSEIQKCASSSLCIVEKQYEQDRNKKGRPPPCFQFILASQSRIAVLCMQQLNEADYVF